MAKSNNNDSENIEELNSRLNSNLILHKQFRPYITDTHRIRYSGLLQLFHNHPHVKKTFSLIHKMSAPPGVEEQFTLNEADNIRSANDILRHSVAKTSGTLLPENEHRNFCDTLQNNLRNDGLEAEHIDQIIQQFDPNVSVDEYLAAFLNLHLLKAAAFSSDRTFFALLNDLRSSGDRKRVVKLTARFYSNLIKNNDNLASDSGRENFLKHLKKYTLKAPLYRPDDNLTARVGVTGIATLNSIRQSCIFNARSCLNSEKNKSRIYTSLEAYSVRDSFPTIEYTLKQLERIAKMIGQSNKEPVSLLKSFHGLPVVWNCYLCPSGDPSPPINRHPTPNPRNGSDEEETNGSGSRPPANFVDTTLARFNVNRVQPLNSKAAVDTHFHTAHMSLTPTQITDLRGHHYLLICTNCAHDDLCNSLICCASHFLGHSAREERIRRSQMNTKNFTQNVTFIYFFFLVQDQIKKKLKFLTEANQIILIFFFTELFYKI